MQIKIVLELLKKQVGRCDCLGFAGVFRAMGMKGRQSIHLFHGIRGWGINGMIKQRHVSTIY